jgi:hypothetical protein
LTSSSTGKRRSAVWDDFTEVTENRNGKKVRIAGICKFCKARLSANSNADTGHLLRHQKSCKKKSDHAVMVQTRLALNPDGSFRNWEYDPQVARCISYMPSMKLSLVLLGHPEPHINQV